MNKKILGILVLILVFAFSTTALASLTFTTDAITGTTASTIDLGAGNTLYFQNTNNGPITTGTGLVTLGGSLTVAGSATFPTLVANRIPLISTGGLLTSDAGIITQGVVGEQKIVGTANATLTVCASNSLNKNKCDYVATGTADEVTIQAAIDALPVGGGHVLLMEGTYTITSPITPVDGTWLQGSGAATIITLPVASAGGFNMISNYNSAHNDNITISDLTLDANAAPTMLGIYQAAGTNLRVERNRIQNSTATSYGIQAVGTTNVSIIDNFITDWGDSGIENKASGVVRITGNYLNRATLQIYAQIDAGGVYSRDYIVSDNHFTDSNVIVTSAGTTMVNYIFTGNTFLRTVGHIGGSVYFRTINNVIFSGNILDGGTNVTDNHPLLYVESTASNMLISGNIFRATTIYNTYGWGAALLAGTGITFTNNDIYIPSDLNYGVKATTTTSGLVIRGNRFVGGIQGGFAVLTGTSGIGMVDLSNTSGTIVENNTFSTSMKGIVVAVSSTGTRILNNTFSSVTTPYANSDTTSAVASKIIGAGANLNGLSVYANNAAAVAGGLVAGDFYRTGGDPDLVGVVH